jgi:3-hydroxybutyryl-CoA dehydratase
VTEVDEECHHITIAVEATREETEKVLEGTLSVCPPYALSALDSRALENF